MKLATYLGTDGSQRIAAVDVASQTLTDLQQAHQALHGRPNPDFISMLALIDGGDAALQAARDVVARQPGKIALASVKLLAPLPEPRQMRDCNNFEQHMRDAPWGMMQLKARMAGLPPPDRATQPPIHPVNFKHIVFYITNRFSVVGPEAVVEWPSYSEWMDYEGEFAIVIGKRGKNIPPERAMEHIFGYTIFNDFSARDQQGEEMDGRMGPTKGKSFDTGNVLGPWIVTRDEIPDYRALTVTVRVNGKVYGSNTTAGMVHSYEDMVAYISHDETLHAGEVIGSGTIGGCSGMETNQWLKDGDVVEVEVTGLGILRNTLRKKAA